MYLLLLCLGTILAPTCPVSCQPSCSLPPLFGSVGVACFHPFSRSTTALRGPAPQPLLLHHQSRVTGRGGWRQPHGCGRHAWQPASPRQTAGLAPRRSCRNQEGLVFRPAGLFTFLFSGAATIRSRNCFPTRRGGFCTPRTSGTFTASTDAVPVSSTGTATEVDL
jgi:hypothetical protein